MIITVRRPGRQPCWSEPWTGFSARTVRMFQDGYASPADIDTAMMLGCGYPRGPFKTPDEAARPAGRRRSGGDDAATGDPAFTPVPLLAEYATAGTRFRS